jgi:hypothetical protein
MTERFNKMKREQEIWTADADELRRLRAEMKHYRELLSAAEARELNKSHKLEMIQRELSQLEHLQSQLQEARAKAREMEYKEFEFEQAKREVEILQSEKETLQMKLSRQEIDRERAKRVYADRITELEVQNSRPSSSSGQQNRSLHSSSNSDSANSPAYIALQQSLTEAQSRLAALKKAHTRLLERHTDLELDYQSLRSQVAGPSINFPSSRNGSIRSEGDAPDIMSGAQPRSGIISNEYDLASDFGDGRQSEYAHTHVSTSDPSSRRFHHPQQSYTHHPDRGLPISPISMPKSEPTPWSSASRFPPAAPHRGQPSISMDREEMSRTTSGTLVFNKTEPLRADERSVKSGDTTTAVGREQREREKREKILPQSEVRVYGRGEFISSF